MKFLWRSKNLHKLARTVFKMIFGADPVVWWCDVRDRSDGLPLLWYYAGVVALMIILMYGLLVLLAWTLVPGLVKWLVGVPLGILAAIGLRFFWRRWKTHRPRKPRTRYARGPEEVQPLVVGGGNRPLRVGTKEDAG